MPDNTTVTIELPPGLYAILEEVAAELGHDVEWLILQMALDYTARSQYS